MGCRVKRKIRQLKQRYLDWKNWCYYTNEPRIRQILSLFGIGDTTMFDIFRHAWKEKY